MLNFWTQPIVVATYRALVGAVVLAGGSFFGALQAGGTTRAAWIGAGVVFFGYLALRGGLEGMLDQRVPK